MDTEYKNSIIRYYDNTILDYKYLWLNKKNRSVHFGYYEEGIKDHSDALVNLNKQLANRAEVKEGDFVLDAGCGQGGSSFWLAENRNVKVEGITLVPHQVQMAQEEANKRQLNNKVVFSQQDYTETTFPDEHFDVVWACESMCHAQNKSEFYKEAFRVLKPGGRLICADYIRTDRPLDDRGEELLRQWLSGWSIIDIDTTQEHYGHASSIGFIDMHIDNVTEHTKPSLHYLYNMSSRLLGMGKFLKWIGMRNKTNHGNQVASIRQYEALMRDAWYYGIISATKPT